VPRPSAPPAVVGKVALILFASKCWTHFISHHSNKQIFVSPTIIPAPPSMVAINGFLVAAASVVGAKTYANPATRLGLKKNLITVTMTP
jgi:hypothetical protein